jgi:hypothetical protein
MPEANTHLAIFNEIDPAAEAIHRLRELGIHDDQMNIISGLPYTSEMLGRPKTRTMIPVFAVIGFIGGFLVSLLLNIGSVMQYPLIVGGLPLFPIPTTIVVTFEMSMLGLLIFTFLGVIWECAFPSFGKVVYRKDVSDGKIAIEFDCPPEIHSRVHELLGALGAEWVHRTEATPL